MRGRQFYNFPAFDRARDLLLAMGHEPVSPADIDREHGFDGMDCDPADPCDKAPEGFSLEGCITRDVAAILGCDGVCFIDPSWPASKGARAECYVAQWAGKRLFTLGADGLVEISYELAQMLCYHRGGLRNAAPRMEGGAPETANDYVFVKAGAPETGWEKLLAPARA